MWVDCLETPLTEYLCLRQFMLAVITSCWKLEQFFISFYSNEFVWMSPTFQADSQTSRGRTVPSSTKTASLTDISSTDCLVLSSWLGGSHWWQTLIHWSPSIKDLCSHFCYCLHYLSLGFVYPGVQFINFPVFHLFS